MSDRIGNPEPVNTSTLMRGIKEAFGAVAGLAKAAVSITRAQFSAHAAIANMYELEAARIALRRARRQDVKQFAQAMIADHEKVGSELKSFLGGTNSPQMPPDKLDAVHQTLIDDLDRAGSEEFDRLYIRQQKIAHQEAITLFATYYKSGRDGGLRNLAGLALPVLKKHLEMARELEQAA